MRPLINTDGQLSAGWTHEAPVVLVIRANFS